MFTPFNGVQDLVSLIDEVVAARPRRGPLVVAVTAPDPDKARWFVARYADRLSDVTHNDLVPHAHTSPVVLAKVESNGTGADVRLLDELARQFRSTIPDGSGRREQFRQFLTCLDVVEVGEGIVARSTEATRAELLDKLYTRWEHRVPLLAWTRRMIQGELPVRLLGLVLTALLHGPSKWWFGRMLNGSRLRWFGEQVSKANGRHDDFLDQAAWLLPGNGIGEGSSLRRRILFEALLRDLALFTGRHRFLPHRRRRRWTPVLLLDGTNPLARALVDLHAELTADWAVAPLVVIAALKESDIPAESGEPLVLSDAVTALREFVNHDVLDSAPWLPVLLADDPKAKPRADDWLNANLRVTPKVPGRASAFAPLVLTALLVLSTAGFGAYRYYLGGCSDTMVNAGGERVGVIESGCGFGYVADTPGVPVLTDLEKAVFANNAVVDKLKNDAGDPRYYREVVFFAPLTRPDTQERTAPVNAIWQLEGAVGAQRAHNEAAKGNAQLVPIKLVLANSGDRFADGDWVADRITARGKSGRGGLAAVIGISQSRPNSREVVRDRLVDVPVVASSMYGSAMLNDRGNLFMSAPLNPAFATAMTTWTRERGYQGAAVVYDPADPLFSLELHDLLAKAGVGTPATDIQVGEENTKPVAAARLKELCANADSVLPVFAGRADQIRKVLDAASTVSECAGRTSDPVRVLGGPGMVVEAASGNLARYPWLRVTTTALASDAAGSDRGTGADAFRVAAIAVAGACEQAGENWDPPLVRAQLERDDFTIDGRTGQVRLNDAESVDRIRLIEVPATK